MPSTLLVRTDEWRQCLLAEQAETHIPRREADLERTDMVEAMVGEAVADLEVHEEVMVAVVADPWALPHRLATGDAARGQVLTVVEVVAASEAEEVVTSESLPGLDVFLAMRRICTHRLLGAV